MTNRDVTRCEKCGDYLQAPHICQTGKRREAATVDRKAKDKENETLASHLTDYANEARAIAAQLHPGVRSMMWTEREEVLRATARALQKKKAHVDEVSGHGPFTPITVRGSTATIVPTDAELREVLEWAVPLAEIAMEAHRYERIKNGHNRDICGTYKSGVTWVGIYQNEVDQIERAREVMRRLSNPSTVTEGR